MSVARNIGIGIFVVECIRLAPMLIAFWFMLSIMHGLFDKSPGTVPNPISYTSPGHLTLYFQDQAVTTQCESMSFAIDQSKSIGQASAEANNCEFFDTIKNGWTKHTYNLFSRKEAYADETKKVSINDLYPYLKQNGKEFRDINLKMSSATGEKQTIEHCLIENWKRVTYKDEKQEMELKLFCPSLMEYVDPYEVTFNPKYINYGNDQAGFDSWHPSMEHQYMVFDMQQADRDRSSHSN